MNTASLNKLVKYWQTLTPDTIARIGEVYKDDATFQDPFNAVKGLPAISHIFHDMFVRCHAPRFVITETIMEDNRALLVWDFTFRLKSLKPDLTRKIHGTSLIRFAADGRVQSHRDYWDAAGELYEQLPIIGSIMRWLKKRMA
jgi:steroid Delta-isomerase